jgi:hypothetical protein
MAGATPNTSSVVPPGALLTQNSRTSVGRMMMPVSSNSSRAPACCHVSPVHVAAGQSQLADLRLDVAPHQQHAIIDGQQDNRNG